MMEWSDGLALGLSVAFTIENLAYCAIGVSIGMLIGVLPGIGHMAAISLLLPMTYHVPATASLVMLAGIYYGAQYGGSIASILLNVPGTASSAVLCLDGYPMTRNGRAGVALLITTVASFFGSLIAIAVLVAIAPPLARIALEFHSADYFAMLLLGLVASGTLVERAPLIGLTSMVIGLVLGLVGMDVNTGLFRFTFGIPYLFDGLNIIALAMALFGVCELIARAGQLRPSGADKQAITFRSMLPTAADWKQTVLPMLRGGGIGTAVGVLPGAGGGSMAAFMAYAVERRVSRTPKQFGKGAIPGITAPESANNAASQSAFIPTLTLGIPGDAIMVLMLGALMIHGILPGPRVVTDNPELFWGLIVTFMIGNVFLLVLNIPLIQLWVRILRIPYRHLFPSIVLLIAIGCYSLNGSYFDVLTVAVLGFTAYLLILIGFEPAPLLLGFILSPMLEENFRRALRISNGDFSIFINRPIAATFVALSAALLLWMIVSMLRDARREKVGG